MSCVLVCTRSMFQFLLEFVTAKRRELVRKRSTATAVAFLRPLALAAEMSVTHNGHRVTRDHVKDLLTIIAVR